jgi:hypothetical protein
VRALRVALIAPLLAFAGSGLAVAASHGQNVPLAGTGCAQAAGVHHAAVVAEHADGTVLRRCVPFSGDTIGGVELLDASGIQHAYADYGSLGKGVCQVDYEPRQYPPSCVSPDTPSYWVLFTSAAGDGGRWATASQGISGLSFHDGDAEGFRYDPQTGTPQPPPSPNGVCGTPQPAATAVTSPTRAAAGGPGTAPGGTSRPAPAGFSAAGATGAAATGGATAPPATGGTSAPSVASAAPPAGTPSSPVAPVLAASAGGGMLGLLVLRLRRPRHGPHG